MKNATFVERVRQGELTQNLLTRSAGLFSELIKINDPIKLIIAKW